MLQISSVANVYNGKDNDQRFALKFSSEISAYECQCDVIDFKMFLRILAIVVLRGFLKLGTLSLGPPYEAVYFILTV